MYNKNYVFRKVKMTNNLRREDYEIVCIYSTSTS